MIDIETERLRLLTKASGDIPGRPHISTLIRWTTRGSRGVKLESIVVGGRRFTSVEAIQRFIASLNEPGSVTIASQSKKRQMQLDRVDARLDAERIR